MFKFKLTIPAQEIPLELTNGTEVILQGAAAVESQVVKDSHSDEPDITSILKPIWIEVRPSDSPIQAPPVFRGDIKHKSDSQLLRAKDFIIWQKMGSKGDFNAYHHECMQLILDKRDQTISDLDMEGLV